MIYSPSLRQNLYQKLIKCFTIFIPIKIIQDILNEKDLELLIEEIVSKQNIEKLETEVETYESIEELNYQQDYGSDFPIVIVRDVLNQKNADPRVQALSKRPRHNKMSIFIISQDYYDLRKKLFGPTVTYSIYSNQTITEMFEISMTTKQIWIKH